MRTPFHGALSLLVFLLAVISTYALAPQGLKLRIPRSNWSVPISFCWVPWAATALLLLFQAITFAEVGTALTGDSSLRPSAVIVTYISLAYLAVSCEITGLFSWLALHAAQWARGRPLLLLAAFFALSGALTAVTGPEVSLVALTPMVVYAAGASNLDPMAMAATHLGAASVCSLLVSVAGTVNIITSHAFQLTLMRFLGWMLLPTCAAAVVVFGLLYVLLHRSRLVSARCDGAGVAPLPYPDPGVMLHDQVGAACNSALLAGCLLALAVAPWLRWSGWLVAAVFALVAALYNLAASTGPLRGAIGRRSAYERRRRLQAELAQQGLHRLVSDEDLADLLLSAAQHRHASLTRLAAATASRVHAASLSAALPPEVGPNASAATLQPTWQQSQSQQQPQLSAFHRRPPSGGGWTAFGRRSSSSSGIMGGGGGSLGHSLPSAASLGASGGSGFSHGTSPVRQWFSRRWSSLRGFSLPAAASSELVEAAADAGADLGILGQCGVMPPAATAAAAHSAAAAGTRAAAAAAEVGEAGRGLPRAAAGGKASVGGAVSGPLPGVLPRVSLELQQLLTRGTSAAPDSLEWWAAAAVGAQELMRTGAEAGLAGGSAADPPSTWTSTAAARWAAQGNVLLEPPRNPLLARVDEGEGGGDVRGAGNCCRARSGRPAGAVARAGGAGASCGGSLTLESPFADPAVMWGQAWGGSLSRSPACWHHTVGAGARQGADTTGAGGSFGEGSGGGLARLGSHRRQRSCESVGTLAKLQQQQQPRGCGAAGSRAPGWGEDPLDTCGAADSGSGHVGGGGGRWKGGAGGAAAAAAAVGGPVEAGGFWGDAAAGASRAVDAGAGSGGGGGAVAVSLPPPSGSLPYDPLDPNRRPDGRPTWLRSAPGGRPSGRDPGTARTDAAVPSTPSASPHASRHPQRAPSLPPRPPSPSLPDPLPRSSRAHNLVAQPGEDDHGHDRMGDHCGGDAAAAEFLWPPELDDLPLAARRGSGCDWSSTGDGDGGCGEPQAVSATWAGLPRRATLPSASGFEGLFGCWRRNTDPDVSTESAALLPARAAPSDDPCHLARAPLPPLPPLPLPLAGSAGQPCLAASGAAPRDPTAGSSVRWPGDSDPAAAAGDCSAAATAAAPRPCSGCPHSPFTFAVVCETGAGAASEGDVSLGAAEGFGGCGGGGAARCGSYVAGGGGSASWGWGQCKLRRPSVALLMLGPGEVGFLGTFSALPWANAVWLLGWFVLVEALQVHGWVDSLARFLSTLATDAQHAASNGFADDAADDPAALAGGDVGSPSTAAVASTVFAIGWLAVLLSLGMTGQSAALLLARVMTRPEFLSAASAATTTPSVANLRGPDRGFGGGGGGSAVSASQLGARLALVVGANLAPALSLSGSLIALRWGLGLTDLGVRLRCCKYVVSGLLPAAVGGTAAALLVLWAQCWAWK